MAMGFLTRRPAPGPPKTGAGLPLAVGTGPSSNPDKLGLLRAVRAPAPTVGDPTRTTPINFSLTWLLNALGLQNSAIPRDLSVTQVTPTLDVHQKGWATCVYTPSSRQSDSGAIAPTPALWVLPPDPVNTQVVVALTMLLRGTTSVANIRGILFMAQGQVIPPSATSQIPTWPSLNYFAQINAFLMFCNAVVSTFLQGTALVPITGGTQNAIIIPPGFGLAFTTDQAILAGQFIQIDMVSAIVNGQSGVR